MLPSDNPTITLGAHLVPVAIESLLAGLPLMAPLSEPERRLVAACFERVAFEYGETVVAEGELATAYFVIASGRARVLTIGADGREVPLNVLSPGDAFGELALVQQTPRSASVRASTPLELFRLGRSVFQALTRVYPALSETLGLDARALRHADFLRLHPAFAVVPRERLVELAAGSSEVTLADSEIVPRAGPAHAGVYLVTGGRLAAVQAEGQEAADRASRGWAKGEAVALYRQALTLVGEHEPQRRRELRLKLAVALQMLYHVSDAEDGARHRGESSTGPYRNGLPSGPSRCLANGPALTCSARRPGRIA